MAAYTLQPTSLPTNNSSENKLLSTFLHAGSDSAQQVTARQTSSAAGAAHLPACNRTACQAVNGRPN